ncbi:MAG: methyltransferase domain-containing protein [Candidatus Bathyarchaeia archaeon]
MGSEHDYRVVEYYRKVAESYDEEYSGAFWKEIYDKITWRYIEPYLPADGVVLDAGGGTGKWAIPIAKKGLKVMIYDISEDMLKIAVRKVEEEGLRERITVKVGNICNMDLPNESFDFVLAEGDPLSYCGDPDKAVSEFHRILKPKCFVVAGVDNAYTAIRSAIIHQQDTASALKVLRGKRYYSEQCGFHWWTFTPKDLKQLFEKNGFNVVKIVGKPVLYIYHHDKVQEMLKDSEKAEQILNLELALCEDPSIVGCGGHLHIVARKE